jgi:hypothetical protein
MLHILLIFFFLFYMSIIMIVRKGITNYEIVSMLLLLCLPRQWEKCRLAENVALLANSFMLAFCLAYSSTPKLSTCPSEISVDFQRTTVRYIPEDKWPPLWRPQILNRKCISKVTYFNQKKALSKEYIWSQRLRRFIRGMSGQTTYCFFSSIFFLYCLLHTTVIEGAEKM